MSHQHHHHSHGTISANINRAFWWGIILNSAFVITEFIAGFYYNSLALLSDAGHNLSDVSSLAISLFALKISKAKSTSRFTYGFHKSTILASLINAVILLIAVGSIGLEAIQRFQNPVNTEGKIISVVAAIGIVINAVSAFLFFRDKENDLNAKGAYLHLLTDALVSIGVVIAGIIITYTGLTWIDPLISLLIMAIVIFGTWNLLTESLRLSLDAVPQNIETEKIIATIKTVNGVKDVHHIHIWAMSTTKNAMTAHLVLENDLSESATATLKSSVKHELEHLNIQHATLETEFEKCSDEHD